jgi:hypothetical protein
VSESSEFFLHSNIPLPYPDARLRESEDEEEEENTKNAEVEDEQDNRGNVVVDTTNNPATPSMGN